MPQPRKASSPEKRFARRFAEAVSRGQGRHPEWASPPSLSSRMRRTWYASVRVRQDVRGDVSDLTMDDVDRRAPPKVVTVALLGVAPDGTIRGLTGAEIAKSFDRLLGEAVRRHGLVPSGSDFVRAVFRHGER